MSEENVKKLYETLAQIIGKKTDTNITVSVEKIEGVSPSGKASDFGSDIS